ncbi:nineteen complex-related protein 2-domain-containing protein [Podospora australis]|uniref:Nineteen complex-related protein 2-domain-containing protein n=1 Tax=Podospora australis TaxID=1536484 RepID=A0AAN7AGN1_9PEZI|nr:nineteen complex-related protein 2-domain-containing protein [Podospora australis]
MSAFGAKRKAKIIKTFDDDGDDLISAPTTGAGDQPNDEEAPVIKPIKFRSKPAKSSTLRKSINITDESESPAAATTTGDDADNDDDSSAPAVVRPALSRAGSKKIKKRPAAASRLSFGGAGEPSADGGDDPQDEKPFTPKKSTLSKRALENNALLRRSASLQNLGGNLPLRFGGGEEDRPKYSKEYLEELQSSTPATPQAIDLVEDADVASAMELDPSEIEGALIVQQTSDLALAPSAPPAAAHVLSALEIRERKDRRARLAGEAAAGDFITLDSGSDDEPPRASSRVTLDLSSSRQKKKNDTRLIAEDEDLGEGYDEFVLDNPLALGKKAEKEASRRHRQEIAEMINAAQSDGDGSDEDESDAERKAAYEAAQRRAGLDGLHLKSEEEKLDRDAIPRMKPLPKLAEVLQRMNEIVQGIEDEVKRKRSTIEGLEKERREIEEREREVQEILNQAGAKYQEVVGVAAGTPHGDVRKLVQESIAHPGQSPLRHPFPPGMTDAPVQRGLESFGTPTRGEYDGDDVMMG